MGTDFSSQQTASANSGSELPDKEVTIRFATQSMDREKSVRYDVLRQFQEDYPNVTLEIEESPGNDLITKINTDVMGETIRRICLPSGDRRQSGA